MLFRSGECLAFAGLWERWQSVEDELIESCVIITTSANETLARVHQRMPVLLGDEAQELWLAESTSRDDRLGLLKSDRKSVV